MVQTISFSEYSLLFVMRNTKTFLSFFLKTKTPHQPFGRPWKNINDNTTPRTRRNGKSLQNRCDHKILYTERENMYDPYFHFSRLALFNSNPRPFPAKTSVTICNGSHFVFHGCGALGWRVVFRHMYVCIYLPLFVSMRNKQQYE